MKISVLCEDKAFAVSAVSWTYATDCIDEITLCSNSQEFIMRLGSHDTDLVFIELGNPNIPGLEIAQLVQCVVEEAKIVFISPLEEYVMDAFEYGAFNYLLTPVKKTAFDCLIGMAC